MLIRALLFAGLMMRDFVRLYAGPRWLPRQARIQTMLARTGELQDSFGDRIVFGTPGIALAIPDALLSRPRSGTPAFALPAGADRDGPLAAPLPEFVGSLRLQIRSLLPSAAASSRNLTRQTLASPAVSANSTTTSSNCPVCTSRFVPRTPSGSTTTITPGSLTRRSPVSPATSAHVLRSPLAQPFAFSQGWVASRGATLVEVSTDEGITGWGEALCQGLQPPEIAAAAVESALKPLAIGADPLQPEVLWHRMYQQTRDYGLKGAVIGAISGVDIALWDICGKARGAPVAELLGGRFRDRVQAYATGFYRITGQGEAARLAEEAVRHHDSGFRAMKVKLGFGIDDDLAVMRAVRRALVGRACEVMIDSNRAYGVAEAIRLGRGLEEMGWRLRWYEEPVTQEDLEGYGEVRRALSAPIAGGENEFTLFGFRELFGRAARARPRACARARAVRRRPSRVRAARRRCPSGCPLNSSKVSMAREK